MILIRDADLNPESIKYSLYFAILSPLYIAWDMMPVFLLMSGYRVLTIGVLYSLSMLAEVALPYLIGTRFGSTSLNHVMAVDNLLSGCSYLLFASENPLALAIAVFLQRTARALSPVYETYSYLVFPPDQRVKARALFLAVPEVTQGIAFIVLGVILGIACPTLGAFRLAFAVMGLLALASTFFPLVWLPRFTGSIDMKKVGLRMDWSLFRKPIVAADMLIHIAGTLVPMVVWTYYAIETLKGTFFLVALVEAAMSIGVILAARLVSKTSASRDLFVGVSLMGLSSMLLIKPSHWVVMVVAYCLSSIGSTLWDPHHTDLLYQSLPSDRARAFFGSLRSVKRITSLTLLPIAAALAESTGSLNYSIACSLTLLSIFVYFRILRMGRNTAKTKMRGGGTC